jgi:hypothetical protein
MEFKMKKTFMIALMIIGCASLNISVASTTNFEDGQYHVAINSWHSQDCIDLANSLNILNVLGRGEQQVHFNGSFCNMNKDQNSFTLFANLQFGNTQLKAGQYHTLVDSWHSSDCTDLANSLNQLYVLGNGNRRIYFNKSFCKLNSDRNTFTLYTNITAAVSVNP